MNEFYFPEPISMVGGYFYIMAIVQYGGTFQLFPILKNVCGQLIGKMMV